jgi:uncharacterized damage-inducible protein DinB
MMVGLDGAVNAPSNRISAGPRAEYPCRPGTYKEDEAMSTPLTPDKAQLLLSVELTSIKAEWPVTRAVITAIPPDKCDYTPDPVTRSAIELAWHIVSAENRFLEAVVGGAFDLTPRPRPETVRTPADVGAWYDERLPQLVERLKGVTADDLAKPVDFRGILKFPAVVFLRIGLNHSIHHRGQLSMYLRPMGAAVPSIYGESYDARTAREAREVGKS